MWRAPELFCLLGSDGWWQICIPDFIVPSQLILQDHSQTCQITKNFPHVSFTCSLSSFLESNIWEAVFLPTCLNEGRMAKKLIVWLHLFLEARKFVCSHFERWRRNFLRRRWWILHDDAAAGRTAVAALDTPAHQQHSSKQSWRWNKITHTHIHTHTHTHTHTQSPINYKDFFSDHRGSCGLSLSIYIT